MGVFASIVAMLVLVLGVPTRLKYYWQGSKIRRRKSARDVSRKFYLVSWVVYVLQVLHNIFVADWVNVAFWSVGIFTVSYCIYECFHFWHVKMSVWRWIIDSFADEEGGGLFK
jgi:hypothetical protein